MGNEMHGRLNVYKEVNREIPLHALHWFIDHAETMPQGNMDRIAALGGGIAIQHRMAFQGGSSITGSEARRSRAPAYPRDAAARTGSRHGRYARRIVSQEFNLLSLRPIAGGRLNHLSNATARPPSFALIVEPAALTGFATPR
jgi:hypothetical protein